LLKIFLDCSELLDEVDPESYLFDVWETAKMFEGFFNETHVTYNKIENSLFANVVTTNLAKRFSDMVEKNKIFVLMSGTIHSAHVLESIFGLKNFKMINAETKEQGEIVVKRTGNEMDCKYSNFSSLKYSRKDYLEVLDECVGDAKRPTLVHINAFLDLPNDWEKSQYGLTNLMTQEKIKEIQNEDKGGRGIAEFKQGMTDILFSTRAARGIDFPGEECNSIVFTKYPNPNVQDAFWKILMKTKPGQYWDFYKDKARRELLQKIYRGLRFKDDKVELWSPDSRVLDAFESNDLR